MPWSRGRRPVEDAHVALVEQILDATAGRTSEEVEAAGPPPEVDRALWICACVTTDDSPTWLIHHSADGDLAWRRVPGGTSIDDLVDARQVGGGHADPGEVFRWLRGEVVDPWGNGGHGEGVNGWLDEVRTRITGGPQV